MRVLRVSEHFALSAARPCAPASMPCPPAQHSKVNRAPARCINAYIYTHYF